MEKINRESNKMKSVTEKPNFFVVGWPKCGTTVLYKYFKEHPQVTVAKKKEPHPFYKGNNSKTANWQKKLNEFLHLFSENNVVQADFSPRHIWDEDSAKKIHGFNPNSKILIIIREPTKYLQSRHNQSYKRDQENLSFKEALYAEEKRRKGKKIPIACTDINLLFYSMQIEYAKKVRPYIEIFSKSQIKIIVFEEFKRNNQKTMDKLCGFLNIKKIKVDRKEVNTRKQPRFKLIRKLLVYLRKHGRVSKYKKIIPLFIRKSAGICVDRLTLEEAKKKSLNPAFERELKKRFKPEVEKINRLLNKEGFIDKDLVKYWGYKGIK